MFFYTELQQSGGEEEEWVLTRAADLTSYRNLKAKDEQLKKKEINEAELRMMKGIGRGIAHENESLRQQLREKEQLVKQLEKIITTQRQELDQLKLLTTNTSGL